MLSESAGRGFKIHSPELWSGLLTKANSKWMQKLRTSLSSQERAEIIQYYTAKKLWEGENAASFNSIVHEVRRNPRTVFGWLKEGKRPKTVQLVESIRVSRGVLVSWPPLKETLEELYIRREMSTHQIADIFGVDGSMVFQWLKKFRVPLRDRVEAYVRAVTKYPKRPFSGNRLEAAYMIGLRLSDYNARWASREGRTVSVRTGTTHPRMIQLAKSVFGPYGSVVVRPRVNNHGGYHWEVECHLDSSFGFLVPRPQGIPTTILDDHQTFLHCFAGLVDGDGWISLHNCWNVKATTKLGFCNTDHRLVEDVVWGLLNLGYVVKPMVDRERGSRSSYGMLNNSALRLQLKGNNAIKLLRSLPLRHPEKLARKSLALELHGKAWGYAKTCWDELLASINAERDRCVAAAERAHNARKNGNHKLSDVSF